MTEDELLLIYKGLRDMTEAMRAREAALDQKTAALDAAIAQLRQLPETLGRQTSQYIASGVRQSIQDDFSRPLADAVKGPIAEFSQATYYARDVMRQVGEDVRFRSRTWLAAFVLFGCLLGGATVWCFFLRDLGQVKERLQSIQEQMTPPAPVANAPTLPKTLPKSGRPGPASKPKQQKQTQPAAAPDPEMPEPPQ